MFAEIIPVKRGPLKLPFFDYSVPPEMESSLSVGQLVVIPFRKNELFGVVKKIKDKTTVKNPALITKIVCVEPLLSEKTVHFAEEISDFYFTSLGFIIKSLLPPLQKRKLAKLIPKKQPKANGGRYGKPNYVAYKNNAEKIAYLEKVIAEKGQHLIIVPELLDIEALHRALAVKTQERCCLVSSYTSNKELFAIWEQVWTGEKNIIIGTRSALFLSFHNLQSITVDVEGSFAHKSWDSAPRFHARDAALILGKHLGASVHLLAHRPQLESWYLVKNNIYNLKSPELLPELQRTFEIVDTTKERRAGNTSPISLSLQETIENHPTGSVFLFCHRRGSGGYCMCRDCKAIARCPRCTKILTYHRETAELRCHSCAYHEAMREECPVCCSVNLTVGSPGTDTVVREYKKLFPNDTRPIIECSSDQINWQTELATDKDIVIVGTEAVWGAVPWQKLSVLGFIDADAPLFVPEFHMSEMLWQKMNDARYRTADQTEIVIQTNHRDHPVFTHLTNPAAWYENELKERNAFGYPPYSFIVKLFYKSANNSEAAAEARRLYQALGELTKGDTPFTISAPQPFFPPFYRGFYWQGIIVKLPLKNYKQLFKKVLSILPETWKVDPNPNTLLSI